MRDWLRFMFFMEDRSSYGYVAFSWLCVSVVLLSVLIITGVIR